MRTSRFERFFLLLLCILLVINLFCYSYMITRPELEVKEYYRNDTVINYFNENNNKIIQNKDKKIIRNNIEDELNIHFYLYIGTDHFFRGNTASGYANILCRFIVVCEEQPIQNYIWTLTHELIHLKYFNSDETWVNFQTFKFLYESNNEDFNIVASKVVTDYLIYGNIYCEYDISYYVCEYIKDKVLV